MTTYTTYQEAKIANRCADIYILDRVGLFTFSEDASADIVRFSELCETGIKCNPADYCMTVEKFLADGHEFVGGDICLDHGSVQSLIDDYEIESFNEQCKLDINRYILRAAALDEKPSEKVEWVNGDECRYVNDINHEYIYIGEHPHGDGHYAFSEDKGITYIANGYLIGPETPQQREDRERLEAAYDLYCYVSERSGRAPFPIEYFTKSNEHRYKDEYLAIVDKTNYRKGVE